MYAPDPILPSRGLHLSLCCRCVLTRTLHLQVIARLLNRIMLRVSLPVMDRKSGRQYWCLQHICSAPFITTTCLAPLTQAAQSKDTGKVSKSSRGTGCAIIAVAL